MRTLALEEMQATQLFGVDQFAELYSQFVGWMWQQCLHLSHILSCGNKASSVLISSRTQNSSYSFEVLKKCDNTPQTDQSVTQYQEDEKEVNESPVLVQRWFSIIFFRWVFSSLIIRTNLTHSLTTYLNSLWLFQFTTLSGIWRNRRSRNHSEMEALRADQSGIKIWDSCRLFAASYRLTSLRCGNTYRRNSELWTER